MYLACLITKLGIDSVDDVTQGHRRAGDRTSMQVPGMRLF